VWRDNWISRDGGLKIIGRRKFTRIKWVKSLLGNGHNGWNVRLVQEIFLPHDAEEILKTKIPNQTTYDKIAWHYEKDGNFSVRSAYKLAYTIREGIGNSTSNNPNGERKIWTNIWKALVPNKVRVISWRLASDNLPSANTKKQMEDNT
jgi:hypothetical protein